jgi:putative MATE family efflux protein
MINLAVVPIVNSVDTFFVGRLGSALALAGQAAANQAFFTLFFLINYLPTITAPLVASAVGSGNRDEAQRRVCESLFLGNFLGLLGTVLLSVFPRLGLSLILSKDAPALAFAIPYLRLRSLGMVPALISATGFAAYRGLLNTVTPLKVSVGANLINLVLDPFCMYSANMGFTGAALATAIAEMASGLTYVRLLLGRQLLTMRMLIRIPSLTSLAPLIQGGTSMLLRQAALNMGGVVATRRAQAIDPTGVAAAGYGIVMQIYSVGIVVHVAMQGTAAALVPATLARQGAEAARRVADRMFVWGSIVGLLLGIIQLMAVPRLVPLFSTLPSVQDAAKVPALLASILHVINGPVFAGEGVMLGLGNYRDLMLITAVGISTMVVGICLPMGRRLEGILLATIAFCSFQAIAVVLHYLYKSPLAVTSTKQHRVAAT